jgi:formate C-acetyltransferase
MDKQFLEEIREYAAIGLYEGLDLPFPRMYGLAYRYFYENMPVRVHETRLLTPFEGFYNSRRSLGDAMNGGYRSNGIDGAHHGISYIFNPFHSNGMTIEGAIADEKKAEFPQYAEKIDALIAELTPYLPGRGEYIHSNPDMEKVISHGFNYYKKQIEDGITEAEKDNDASGFNFLLSLKDFAAGIDGYFKRVITALSEAIDGADSTRKAELTVIRDAFAKCFYEPAESFISGFLAVNFVWMLDGCDSIGRIDFVLGDLFEKDIASGALDIEFARRLLDDLWWEYEAMNGWNLQIGGRKPDGTSCYNLLTKECILCNARNKYRRPNLALRVTDDMPDDIMEAALESIAVGNGKPALYNDDLYIKTLMDIYPDLPYEDAARYGFGGCTETMIAGFSCVDSLAASINLAAVMERALNDGISVMDGKQAGPQTGKLTDFETFDALLEAFHRQVDAVTERVVNRVNYNGKRRATEGDPKISRSMFTRGCIESKKSFEAGGARYNWSTVSYDGSTVVIDSLYAIKHLVYDKKVISREELADALRNNFEGYEQIRRMLLNAPKFGNDNADADALAADVMRYTWQKMLDNEFTRGGRFIPSVILFATYEGSGRGVSATANGRLAGKPLNDSIGAFEGSDKNGPTALIKSVLQLPHTLAIGTPVFNMRFSKSLATDEKGKQSIKNLIKTYFKGGGLQLQLTVLSTDEMRAAQKNPEQYQDLIVRIGGYSEFFVYLSPALQETVISRVEY